MKFNLRITQMIETKGKVHIRYEIKAVPSDTEAASLRKRYKALQDFKRATLEARELCLPTVHYTTAEGIDKSLPLYMAWDIVRKELDWLIC